MRVRSMGVAGGWLAGVVAATTVSWAGVSLVGAEVSPSGPAALSQAEVQHRIQAASGTAPGAPSPSAGTPRTPRRPGGGDPAATTPAGDPASSVRSIVAVGGTAVLRCTGNVITARSSPGPGYGLSQESEQGRSQLEVEFSNGTRTSRITASCSGGVLSAAVREQSGPAEDG